MTVDRETIKRTIEAKLSLPIQVIEYHLNSSGQIDCDNLELISILLKEAQESLEQLV